MVDTNIVLEILLEQDRADAAKTLLSATDRHEFYISIYAVHSVGTLLFQKGLHEVFRQFLAGLIFSRALMVITLSSPETELVIDEARQLGLDFDDAYQYVTAERHDLVLVSFDAGFDRTPRGRKTPEQILAS